MYRLILLGSKGLEAKRTVEWTQMVMGNADVPLQTVFRGKFLPAGRFRALHYDSKKE